MISYKKNLKNLKEEDRNLDPTFGSRYFSEKIPQYSLNEKGMPSKAAYELIHDELFLYLNF